MAKEVRKLANRVQDAIQEVNAQIEGMGLQVQKISQETLRSQESIATSQDLLKEAVDAFQGIGAAANQLNSEARTLKEVL